MRFLVDAQLPVALARWLSSRGHPSEHVADCGLLEADDSRIWQFTVDSGLAIITKDEDFALRRNLARTGPTIVWVRKGNVRNAQLLAWFDDALPVLMDALQRGEKMIELY